jgi:hypothetical protein
VVLIWYVALHWKSSMRYHNHNQWINSMIIAVTLDKCTSSKPSKCLIKYSQTVFIDYSLSSDWLDGLIGPSGLLLVVSPPICSLNFNFISGVG